MTVVRDRVINLTNKGVGRDVGFIVDHTTFRQRPGEPNWDAALGIMSLDILKVFTDAVKVTQQQFNVAW
jgi:hypothetical protein